MVMGDPLFAPPLPLLTPSSLRLPPPLLPPPPPAMLSALPMPPPVPAGMLPPPLLPLSCGATSARMRPQGMLMVWPACIWLLAGSWLYAATAEVGSPWSAAMVSSGMAPMVTLKLPQHDDAPAEVQT